MISSSDYIIFCETVTTCIVRMTSRKCGNLGNFYIISLIFWHFPFLTVCIILKLSKFDTSLIDTTAELFDDNIMLMHILRCTPCTIFTYM